MVDLDLKDRKILYQLDLNCRQSNAQIGKKVGLSRKVVDYRIKRMEEEGVITGYLTRINSFRLGFSAYRYLIKFQNVTNKIKEEMIDFLIQYQNLWTVYSSSALFDLGIIIWVKDVEKFHLFWREFNDTFGDYILEKDFSVFLNSRIYRHTCLLPDTFDKNERKKYIVRKHGPVVDIDKLDYDLLNIIAKNARIHLITLGEQLRCSSQTINYRMKNLMEQGVIQSFNIGIDYSKIGLTHIGVGIWFRKLSKRQEIWQYFEDNPYVTYITTNAGWADLNVEFVITNLETLENLIQDVSEKFPDYFHKFQYVTVKNQYLRYLPIMTGSDFKK